MTEWTPEKRVRVAAESSRDAQRFLRIQMKDAREKGVSLRAIAEAAGVSHEQVRRLLRADD